FAGATGVLAHPSSFSASPPILQSQPLLSDQRLARAEHWFSRRGLQFGVPPGAYDAAATERYVMEARQAGAAPNSLFGPHVSPTWKFIGPQPMLHALPDVCGAI